MIDLACILLGLVLLYFGAEWLVAGASELAVRLGISPLVVGLTVVAFGTSAPELAVSIDSNLNESGGMAIGNVLGSNICNLCLVLGVAALVWPLGIQRQVIRREMPILLVATVVFAFFLRDGVISQMEAGIFAGGIILYVVTSLLQAREDPTADSSDAIPPELVEAAQAGGVKRALWNVTLIIIGIGFLVLGANRMVYGGANLARAFGVSEAVIGLTLFAFGTSLPELATSIVAALKKQGDIIVGNAVGSCIFNILAVVGFTGLIAPLEATGITDFDVAVMIVTSFLVLPLMWHRFNINRWEGALLTMCYLGYVGWLVVSEFSA
ncbi:calcium/sodium antiporter [Akkermansiaceae bacterium]|nr:calcium/sodium antiporter [Akkermansiaceae bacterium]